MADPKFDIRRPLFDQYGELLEDEAHEYKERLIALFGESPEARELIDEGLEVPNLVEPLIEFGMQMIGVSPADMTPRDLREILFEIFPAKVAYPDFDAEDTIAELRAFFRFLQREFEVENAANCLKALDEEAAVRLDQGMNDPTRFGISKSLFMMGVARGFDMSTEEGITEWLLTYNQELQEGRAIPVPLPGERGPVVDKAHSRMRAALRKERRKRKIAKASRKKNRKKKKK